VTSAHVPPATPGELLAIVLEEGGDRAATVAQQLEDLRAVEVCSCRPHPEELRDAIRSGGASYLLLVDPDEAIDLAAVETVRAGLEQAPEAVLGTAGLLWRPAALGLEISTRDWRRDNACLHEGRPLARLLALRAVTFPRRNAVLLRAAALGTDLPSSQHGDEQRPATPASAAAPATTLWASLALAVLARGFAWSTTNLGYWPRSRAQDVADAHGWAAALVDAERLALWEEPDDLARAANNLQAEAERAHLELPRSLFRVVRPAGTQTGPAGTRRAAEVPSAPATSNLPALLTPQATAALGRVGPLRRFLIAAGDYLPQAAGPVALHLLCDRLNRLGYDATIAPVGVTPSIPALGLTNPDWLTPLAKMGDRFDRCVAIYPENVAGNPLNSPWVVRWLLHRPGYFNGVEMDAGCDDLLVAWDGAIAPELPVFNLPLVDLTTYFPKAVAGHGRLLWVGKGRVPSSLDRTGMTEISRGWPRSRQALADLLRSAELLVSCDWLSSLTDESLLCGTPVALAGFQQWAEGAPMDIASHLGPGVIACPDGQPGPEELARSAEGCVEFQLSYRRRVERLDENVDALVRMINAHFDRVASRSLASSSS